MANADRPNGFRPVRYASGAVYSGAFEAMLSPTDNLFIGDFVEPTATGRALRDGAYQEVGRAETGDPIVGVVVGFEPNPDNLAITYHASSSTRVVYVAQVSGLILEGQNDAAMAAADVGLNANFIVAAGDTTSGTSNMEIDSTTEATTNTLDLRIVGFVDSPNNEVTTANARMLVMVNRDWYANQVAGV